MSSKTASAVESKLGRNLVYNLLGLGFPIIVAVLSMPPLIRGLGAERFGLLALAWVLAGYFNLFDLGMGRAIVRIVVQRIPYLNSTSLFEAVWAASAVTLGLGILSGLGLYLGADYLSSHFFNVHDSMQNEVETSLQLLAIAIPFTVGSSVLKGTLEGFQRFDWITIAQAPLGSMTYLLPWLISTYTHDLRWIIGGLVVLRLSFWLAFAFMNLRVLAPYPKAFRIELETLRELLRFGFWITTSGVISPLMSYVDRLVIGSLVSVAAVGYYTAPMEIALKIPILPQAILGVIYPAFAAILLFPDRLWLLYQRSFKLVLLVILPISFFFSIFAEQILNLWISAEYSSQSSMILRIVTIGTLANCLAFIPMAFLQAANRPSIPAKFHALEFPVYIGVLYYLLTVYGVVGAAAAWVFRVVLDSLLLHWASLSILDRRKSFARNVIAVLILMVAIFGIGDLSIRSKVIVTVLSCAFYPFFAWHFVFSLEDQRYVLMRIMGRVFKFNRREPQKRTRTVYKVGIAMAAYKPAPDLFLLQLNSIRSQSHQDWECVICFDSTAGDVVALPEVAAVLRDERFKVHQNSKRLGVKGNFQAAMSMLLENEKVDAIAFADQDDYWYPNKLQVLVAELNTKPSGSLVHSDMRLVHVDEDLKKTVLSDSAWEFERRGIANQTPIHLLIRNVVTGASALCDRNLIEKFNEIPDQFELHDMWFSLVASCEGGVYPIHEALYDYIQHDSNVVGAVGYHGFFHWPKTLVGENVVSASVKAWGRTVSRMDAAVLHGLVSETDSAKFKKHRYFTASKFLGLSFLYFREDVNFSRACLVRSMGIIFAGKSA